MYDWRGFSSLPQFDSHSRRRCGNVETRVFCGFPSSEGGQNRCGRVLHHPALGASFPQRGPVYRPFCRECVVWAADGAEWVPFRKPRRMHGSTDSRSEPTLHSGLKREKMPLALVYAQVVGADEQYPFSLSCRSASA